MLACRQPSAFRIIGGKWCGRKIRFVPSTILRASGERARESLFNCLGQRLDGRACLDLFAGGGALGLEAASRGAQRVVCVEQRTQTADDLRRATHILAADNVHIYRTDAESFLLNNRELFDVIFLDPPFADYIHDSRWQHLLSLTASHLAADGVVYCESDRYLPLPSGWRVQTQKKVGAVCWQLLRQQ